MRGNGLIRLDRTTTIEAKLDAVMNKLSSNEKRMHTTHEVGAMREGRRNSAKVYEEEELSQVEQAHYINANKIKLNCLRKNKILFSFLGDKQNFKFEGI